MKTLYARIHINNLKVDVTAPNNQKYDSIKSK
jgi:hypothetical protein